MRRRASLSMLPLLLALLAGPPAAAVEAGAVFSGRVVDAVSGRGVEGAEVVLPELGRGTRSTRGGGFMIVDVPGVLVEADLLIRHPCFHPVTVSLDRHHAGDPFEVGLPFRVPRTTGGDVVPGACSRYGPG